MKVPGMRRIFLHSTANHVLVGKVGTIDPEAPLTGLPVILGLALGEVAPSARDIASSLGGDDAAAIVPKPAPRLEVCDGLDRILDAVDALLIHVTGTDAGVRVLQGAGALEEKDPLRWIS